MERTRKERKADTRNNLLASASHLFASDGYDETTLATIAERAGLHVQTLIRHFPTKSDLLAGLWEQSLAAFETFFLARTGDALSAWRDWVELHATRDPRLENQFFIEAYRLPAITSEAQQAFYRYRELLAEGIADDMGVDPHSDLRPMLIACMLFTGNMHTAQSWLGKRVDRIAYVTSLLSVVDTARAMLSEQFPPAPQH